MPYLDIQQIRSAGAHTVGGRVSVWAHSRPTDCGFKDAEGHYGDIAEPPALVPGVNMGSSVPSERKISAEQQGAGDGCQTDDSGMVSLH